MQPAILIVSPTPGLIYVNGRLAGEVDGDRSVALPVGGYGAVYLEHHPFDGAFLPMTRRVALSGGAPVAASLAGQQGLFATAWPDGLIELELIPERRADVTAPVARLARGDLLFTHYGAPLDRLEVAAGGAVFAHAMPGGARLQNVDARPNGIRLWGELDGGGHYAMALSPGGDRLLLSARGREAAFDESGAIAALEDLNDVVGHARRRQWAMSDGEYQVIADEILWSDGAPRWPSSPAEAALATIEAAQLGLDDEAAGYLAPTADSRTRQALTDLADWDGCAPLRRALPDGRSAVGGLRLLADNLTSVTPVYFNCVSGEGDQGYWRVDWLKIAGDV
ncbi:MAG: hypothetical protein GX558_02700 [Clostridiales bacterium]|nr:hypothetical protein [Clostridiales bacterium]